MKEESRKPDAAAALDEAAEGGVSRRRLLAFAAVAVVSVAGALGYAGHVATRAKASVAAAPRIETRPVHAMPAAPAASGGSTAAPMDRPFVLYRSTALGDTYGRVSMTYLDDRDGPRLVSGMQCERVHAAAGTGICLEARRGAITTYAAHIFDRNFQVRHSFPLAGPPSRARMSPDGRLAAVTVFVTGHSYASTGFVTRTSVIDAVGGQMLVDDLEKLEVVRDGKPFKAVDFNFWGVTFTRDGRTFYATLGTGGKTLLVEADVASRRARVLHHDVECPSLSPDNTKIAFKRRQPDAGPGRFKWGLHVLDLASGRETALAAETRNVDDQVEWLGNEQLLYGMPEDGPAASAATNVWSIAVDASGPPKLLLPLAFSPAVVRSGPQ